ncbi:MAG TPA: hypothetical protein DEG71_06095 [Clostridiales bacterium]|nr:hypothetical protein [Clostridiales bacterium]
MKDTTGFKIRFDIILDGASNKIVVEDLNNIKYIIKFPKEKAGIRINDHVTEFVACKIAKKLDFVVQEVDLGIYDQRVCVVIKMFDIIPETFAGFGSTTLEGDCFEYNLDSLLSLKINKSFGVSKAGYKEWVWDVFMLDMLLGNFDRHERNWGFIKDDIGRYMPSPLYDFGSSLSPRLIGEDTDTYTDLHIRALIEKQQKSGIIVHGEKRLYMDIIKEYKNNNGLTQSILKLIRKYENIDIDDILNYVSNYNKEYEEHMRFLKRILNLKIDMIKEVIAE